MTLTKASATTSSKHSPKPVWKRSDAIQKGSRKTETIRRLRLTQAIAGASFSVFLVFHLANFFLAPFGPEVFNSMQRSLRVVYQFPLAELLLVVLPLTAHIVCAIWLMILLPRRSAWSWHRIAGLFLLLVIVGHVLAVRGPSLLFDVYPEFEGLSFSLWYFPAYFYPYYFLLAVAGFYHMTIGLTRIGSLPLPRSVPRVLMVLTTIWSGLCLLALDGQLFPVPDPSSSDFARLGAELFDLDVSKPL